MPHAPDAPKKSRPSAMRYMLRARSILLFGPIEPKATRDVIRTLVLLDQVSKTKPIRLFLNSPGGLADDGFAIFDMIRFIEAPVFTICTGLAASAATIVMVAATKERRLILPHARVMLHQPSTMIRGTAADISVSAKELLRLRKKSTELYAKETGRSLEQIEKDTDRDNFMAANEAKDYGLIDAVLEHMPAGMARRPE
jgi:ATP-dependent Clp protease protease subunit